MGKKRVSYMYSIDLLNSVDSVFPYSLEQEHEGKEKHFGRAFLVHSLLHSYDLLHKMTVLGCKALDTTTLMDFHTDQYINYLSKTEEDYFDPDSQSFDSEKYGLGYDCPLSHKLLSKIKLIGGATVCGAQVLNENLCDIVLNWNGGWHHAKRQEASGFCYVNDIVLAINEMRKTFSKILYIDLDIHHGDGVEQEFYSRNDVFTFSIHQFEPGYFPGTGAIDDVGSGVGKYYCLNIPLREGASDTTYLDVFTSLFPSLVKAFKPEAVVCQCGADVLVGDPLGGFNVTPDALMRCMKIILGLNLPLLILGGGGYHLINTAKYWTSLTALILDVNIDPEIPDFELYELFCANSSLKIEPCNRRDLNDQTYIKQLKLKAFDFLGKMQVMESYSFLDEFS